MCKKSQTIEKVQRETNQPVPFPLFWPSCHFVNGRHVTGNETSICLRITTHAALHSQRRTHIILKSTDSRLVDRHSSKKRRRLHLRVVDMSFWSTTLSSRCIAFQTLFVPVCRKLAQIILIRQKSSFTSYITTTAFGRIRSQTGSQCGMFQWTCTQTAMGVYMAGGRVLHLRWPFVHTLRRGYYSVPRRVFLHKDKQEKLPFPFGFWTVRS